MEQKIITADNNFIELDNWINDQKTRKIFLVCDDSIRYQEGLNKHLEELQNIGVEIIRFSDFKPNPLYESVVKGVELFNEIACDTIMAVGGGSAMDVAKCIKLYSNMEHTREYLEQEIIPNEMPFLAMPTTAGTGSESTKYAVIYYEGVKQSITHESCIPEIVLLDSDCLRTLPIYQKKTTMMDALCHAIESYWSVNSTDESKEYSREAIKGVLRNMDGYLANIDEGNSGMLMAAHIAGKAINITQTTAGHAMCYKITSLFGCSHGHAAILCDRVLLPWMLENTDKCIDPRGRQYLKETLKEITDLIAKESKYNGTEGLQSIFEKLELSIPKASEEQFEDLKTSVNPVRLKNHPIELDEETINYLYHQILRET